MGPELTGREAGRASRAAGHPGAAGGSGAGAPPGPAGWTYEQAGVSLAAADRVVRLIAAEAGRTRRPEVLRGIGDFAGFFRLDPAVLGPGDGRPVLLATCDGVGTKLEVARACGRWEGIGRDLVAMNVNDLLAHGAEPLFFLDYVAVDRLEPERVAAVVRGMADACLEAGCALLGGETAEVPGLLPPGGMELAGFAVGIAREDRLVDGRAVRPGDVILGLPSSGPHSNGFSLIRAIVAAAGLDWRDRPPGLDTSLAEAVLAPTRLYAGVVRRLLVAVEVRGMAHITGGGLPGNLPRALPPGCRVVLERGSWRVPPVFRVLQELGGVPGEEMERVFNLGIGFAVIVPAGQAATAARVAAEALGEPVPVIGRVVEGPPGVEWR